MRLSPLLLTAGIALSSALFSQTSRADEPYKVIKKEKVGGEGGFDYVYADSDGRKLYVPRSNRPNGRVDVYDLDSLKPVGQIPDAKGVHGVAVDPKTGHGFSSSNPVIMFDTKTLQTIKPIPVEGNPDGIFFEPATQHIFVLSHREPNVTVIDPADGSIVGTINLGGAPEEGASDGKGRVYIDLEDKDQVAVVDPKEMKVLNHYDLGGKGKGPAGLAMDADTGVLFAFCHNQQAVILNAADGKIITTLPIGSGVDAGEFNPATKEAFSSQRDGTLTVIKENSPTDFAVEQNVKTMPGAKTSTLDTKMNQIYLIAAEQAPSTQPAGAAQGGGRPRGRMVPGSFTILVVGK